MQLRLTESPSIETEHFLDHFKTVIQQMEDESWFVIVLSVFS